VLYGFDLMSTTRRGPAPHKHVDLLWAAAKLFARKGVAQTTTREIAEAADTTERTLFKHYGTKEGLVRAVIEKAIVAHAAPTSLELLKQAIEAHDDDVRTWHEALLTARSEVAKEAPELTRLLLVELLRDETLLAQFAAQWKEAAWKPLVALLSRLQREGVVRKDLAAETLARLFFSLNLGFLIGRHVLAPDAGWRDEKEIAAIATFFRDGSALPQRRAR
jgi:AcrR family transcriptional regulator